MDKRRNMNDYNLLKSKALSIVEKEFKNKTDLSGEPFIGHLMRVAKNFNGEPLLEIIALLHDLIEDIPHWTIEKLKNEFPEEISIPVILLTKTPEISYKDYISKIKYNESARLVKLADLKDNMDITRLSSLTDKDISRLRRYHSSYIILNEYNTKS